MGRSTLWALAATLAACAASPVAAQSAMVQCGQQYQAAKAGGTLNGMSWNQFRTDCAARLKAQPASAAAAPAAPAAAAPAAPAPATPASAAPPAVAAAKPAPAVGTAAAPSAAPATGGRAAMLERQKACGAEWRAQKASLVAQTPGLTWPKYWSQCNTRMKTTGH